MKQLKYSEILKQNTVLGLELKSKPSYKISILSNITLHQSKEIIEYSLRFEGLNAQVTLGDYDNIVQDSKKFNESNLVIVHWETANLIEDLHSQVDRLDESKIKEIFNKTVSEIELSLKYLESTPLIIVNQFSSLAFNHSNGEVNRLDQLANSLNEFLEYNRTPNVLLLSIDNILIQIGIEKSLYFRYYRSSKALYSINFFKAYSQRIKPFILALNGRSKKALIFDCDNTLWKGILGEDGFDGIDMSPYSDQGSIFSQVQKIALELQEQGVLIGLCSKNNFEDVDQVLKSHPDMQLKDKHIAINKCNWAEKTKNLIEIGQILNIGLDSLVFVDDSVFEVNLVREKLPEVTVLQVPNNLQNYIALLNDYKGLFHKVSQTQEDTYRTIFYKQQTVRQSSKQNFDTVDEYLASLELKIRFVIDDVDNIARLSQLCQKTNQFNLTTKRHTEDDIKGFIEQDCSKVISLTVSDKFGNNGITALCIFHISGERAEIDSLLMSCRIIGRNIEYALIDNTIDFLKKNQVSHVSAKYVATQKNSQVKEFYENCSFNLTFESETEKNYILKINQYEEKHIHYIEVCHDS